MIRISYKMSITPREPHRCTNAARYAQRIAATFFQLVEPASALIHIFAAWPALVAQGNPAFGMTAGSATVYARHTTNAESSCRLTIFWGKSARRQMLRVLTGESGSPLSRCQPPVVRESERSSQGRPSSRLHEDRRTLEPVGIQTDDRAAGSAGALSFSESPCVRI